MRWVLKRLQKRQLKSYKKYYHHIDICYHEPTEIISVSKEIVSFISRDELLVKLAQELGPNAFNDWFKVTFNKPAPYIYTEGSIGRFKSKQFKINKDLLEGDENE